MIYMSFPVTELLATRLRMLSACDGACCVPSLKVYQLVYREMTNDASFMWVIKISKDLFSCFILRLKDKKTSLNNGWEKGLLRKASQCDAIELSRTWVVDRRDSMSGWDMRKEECLMVWPGLHRFVHSYTPPSCSWCSVTLSKHCLACTMTNSKSVNVYKHGPHHFIAAGQFSHDRSSFTACCRNVKADTSHF